MAAEDVKFAGRIFSVFVLCLFLKDGLPPAQSGIPDFDDGIFGVLDLGSSTSLQCYLELAFEYDGLHCDVIVLLCCSDIGV